jgi:RNA polymerase sigma-70 factor (ECF subfamily)
MTDFPDCVEKARNGDTEAFAKLYSTIYKELYYVALCNLKNSHDAADAVSDAVLDAFMSISKLKNADAFKGWMMKILTTKIKRKQAEYIQNRNNTISTPENNEQTDRENRFGEIEILEQLDSLNENEKLCFSLNAVCGYTSEDISKLLGMKSSTVRSHLLRGREKLKKQLVSD